MSRLRIDHLGIIVADLDKAIERFRFLIGGKPAYTKDMPDVGLRIATFEAENISLELIEYVGPESNFAKEVMGNEIGLNHISIGVNDLNKAINEFTEAKFKIMDGFPREGSHGQVAFFRRDNDTGLLFEICERTEI
ncbi:MAG: VOC family protein [Rhodospirillales bacterium]|nr:VOC family protein [Rhodospirillales bacterium]